MEIEKFLREADNGTYLMMKVMLIIGISGACRREELTFLDVKNITDKGSYIIIQIPDTKTNVRREFTISPGNFEALNDAPFNPGNFYRPTYPLMIDVSFFLAVPSKSSCASGNRSQPTPPPSVGGTDCGCPSVLTRPPRCGPAAS
ncbi:hypothetical protein MTP99_016525 [Tenebrio molitor]|nr:hypothetical protein MTP99_016525 [Tenebrio molitor]